MMKINGKKTFLISHFSLLLILVVAIAYGIGITRLSFYGDDWIYIYNYHIAGPGSFDLFQHSDRPHSAWIYLITTALFGETPLPYHLFVLLLRWLSAVLFWKTLENSFGKHKSIYAAALLFSVYPGFQQQPVAVEFVMHFASLVLVLFSIWLMQKAYTLPRGKAAAALIFSLFSGGLALFTCEYFIGLELARPIYLFFTIQHASGTVNKKNTLKKTLLYLIPFLCVTIFYFVWRIFIFSFTSYAPKLLNALQEDPAGGIRQLIEKVIQDLLTVLYHAYRLIFSRPADISLPAAAVCLVSIAAAVFFVLHKSTESDGDNVNFQMLLLGVALLLFSGIPYWGTFLDVSVSFPWDRSTLSFSPGAAIVISILLSIAFKPAFFCAAAAVLTAFSVLFHLENTQIYINESDKMNDYFWQLTWRIPDLQKGTIIATEAFPLDRTSDNDLSPIINWIYSPEKRGLAYDYKYFDLDLREDTFYADPDTPTPVEHTYRSHSFSSSTEKTLGIFYRKNGCMQIIDRNNTNYPDLPESLVHISGLSDPDLIITSPSGPAQPPAAIGNEPDHGYCWYFQKTTLAQQTGDKDTAYNTALDILKNDLHPTYASDLAPVILAFLNESDFESAETMIRDNQIGSSDWKYLCEFWQNDLPDNISNGSLHRFYSSHGCR